MLDFYTELYLIYRTCGSQLHFLLHVAGYHYIDIFYFYFKVSDAVCDRIRDFSNVEPR
jgi:hypothetical protein